MLALLAFGENGGEGRGEGNVGKWEGEGEEG